jgi:hypothetical protein
MKKLNRSIKRINTVEEMIIFFYMQFTVCLSTLYLAISQIIFIIKMIITNS